MSRPGQTQRARPLLSSYGLVDFTREVALRACVPAPRCPRCVGARCDCGSGAASNTKSLLLKRFLSVLGVCPESMVQWGGAWQVYSINQSLGSSDGVAASPLRAVTAASRCCAGTSLHAGRLPGTSTFK